MTIDAGVPIEVFIQAITSQLDRAQEALALKARFGTPLTFAVRDLALDLRTHIEVVNNEVVLRPAGPGEGDASMFKLTLTTITKPMIEENTRSLMADGGGPSIRDALGDELTPDEQRKLEWAGVYTVSQLRDLPHRASPEVIERVAQLPVARLRAALLAASRPKVIEVHSVPHPAENQVAIRGINLGYVESEGVPALPTRTASAESAEDEFPIVRLNGTQLDIVGLHPNEIRAQLPEGASLGGTLEVQTEDGTATYRLRGAS